APHGFTLVELLVVITIIGILVGLTIPAVMHVRVIAKQAAVTMDLKQLEMACQAYKEKFGEYPPDFCHVNYTGGTPPIRNAVRNAARGAVLRHLARAFPRYVPGVTTAVATDNHTWDGFVADVTNMAWGINLTQFTNENGPREALTFWLGGRPTIDGAGKVTGFSGFSANPQNPFDNSASRINLFFDFDLTRTNRDPSNGAIHYWPQGAAGNMSSGSLVYFRAENGEYVVTCMLAGTPRFLSKSVVDSGDTFSPIIFPAVDYRLSNPATTQYTWVSPRSFQIFSAGLDTRYSTPTGDASFYPPSSLSIFPTCPIGPYEFPNGNNYGQNTYDDITNFSDGTLENKIP
ncbi:MAG: prepilin-type N-terminal cleavage/methylation domain-containing protein, partial [Planctomycetes bacterium]|nr:prepilin-type N-terminal cleavage/methylation domain-containing protein [Planctomycetota bacterium]MCG2683346.1 prepilin-type N-terminal cleavage/methylation domain-containing protein [Planctomycetales bacterium]